MYKIIALIGEAGVGKDTLMQEILKSFPNCFNEIISCTTRPPREGEINGKNYYFLTEEEFNNSIMFESTCFNNWYYGTPESSLSQDKINIGVFNIQGIYQLRKSPEVSLLVYRLKCKDKTRLIRQLNREENPNVNEIIRRYGKDKEDFHIDNLQFLHFDLSLETKEDLENATNEIGRVAECAWREDKIS